MKELLKGLDIHFPGEPWMLDSLLVLLVVLLLSLLVRHLLRRAERIAGSTSTVWDDAFIRAARLPLLSLLWVVGLTYAASLARARLGLPVQPLITLAQEVGVVLCLAWFLLRLINDASASLVQLQETRGETVDHTTVDALGKLARIIVALTAGLVILQQLGFSVAGLLAFGGIGGIVVGLAAKDMVANLFGGLTVYLDRPFAVGDSIRSPDKAIEGTVEYIGWRHTRIRTPNKIPLYVPNALFSTIVVENPSRMTHRRLQETVGLRYEDLSRVEAIVTDIRVLLENHPDIDKTQAILVNFDTYGDSALNVSLVAHTRTTAGPAFLLLKQTLLLAVGEIVARHGADFAFPSRTLYMAPQTSDQTRSHSS